MGTIYYFDFRTTTGGPAGFPGEPANSVWAGNTTGPVTNGPFSGGWKATFTGGAADDTTYATSPHHAGYMSSTSSVNSVTYAISGFISGHTYKFYVSLGAISITINNGMTIWNDTGFTSSLYDLVGGSVPGTQFMDATGVVRTTASDWVTNNVPVSRTPAVTTLYFGKNGGGNSAFFNTIGIEDTTAVASAPRMGLLGVG